MSAKLADQEASDRLAIIKGDIAPDLSTAGIKQQSVTDTTQDAQVELESVLTEISAKGEHETDSARIEAISNELSAIISGASPDDVALLRRTLLREEYQRTDHLLPNSDEELMPDWREQPYPYRNRLRRKSYEKQKYDLQVELLKLQLWIKETGQRLVILFEGRDAAGKGGTIKRFMEHLNPGVPVSLPWRNPPRRNKASGISSAM